MLCDKRPFYDLEGNLLGLISISKDITELKRREEEIRRQNAMLMSLINSVPDLIFFKDMEGIYIGCNRAFAELVEKNEKDIPGMTDYDFFPKKTADFFRDNDRKMLAEISARNYEEWVDFPDGRRIFDTLKTPFTDSEGRLLGLVGITRDITERKKMETALKESEEFLQGIINNSTAIIMAKDLDGRYILVNDRFCETFELSPEDVIGKTVHDIFPEESAEMFRRDDLAVLESKAPLQEEEIFKEKDLTFLSIKFPVFGIDGKPKAICGIATDITYLKRPRRTCAGHAWRRIRPTAPKAIFWPI